MFSEITSSIYKVACIILGTLLIVAVLAARHYSGKADTAQAELNRITQAQEDAKKQAQRDYNKTVVEIERIKKVYVPKIEYIEKYKGDKNASDCANGINLLRSVEF